MTKITEKKVKFLSQPKTITSFDKIVKEVELNTIESKIYKKSKSTIKNSKVKYAF